MKYVNVILTIALSISLSGIVSQTVQAQSVQPKYRPGEIIIQLREAADVAATAAAFSAGGSSEVLSEELGILRLTIPEEASATAFSEFSRGLASLPDVVRWEPNYIFNAAQYVRPNDPKLSDLWYLERIGAFDAWSIQNESPNVTVAVIDTGVFLDHADLKDNLIKGYDFYNDDADPSADLIDVPIHPIFCNLDPSQHPSLFTKKAYEAHGTHVAGTIGAVGDNNQGIIGITRKVKIMPLKFLGGACGSGDLADAIRAIDYAIQHDADIINASWGGPYSEILYDIINDANENGILFVAAAGNDNQNIDHDLQAPASYNLPNIVTVGASTQEDSKASFSNFGQTIHIAAPGVNIWSTVPAGEEAEPQSGYDAFQGTSMATPIVSGAAALIMAYYPELTHLEVKELLLLSAEAPISLVDLVGSSRRLNLARALNIEVLPLTITEALVSLSEEERQAVYESLTPIDRVRILIAPRIVTPLVASNSVDIPDDEEIAIVSPTPAADQPTDLSGEGEGTIFTAPRQFVITAPSLADAEAVEATLASLSANVDTVVSERLRIYEVTVSSDLSTDELVTALEEIPGVERAEPNYEYSPND